MKTAARLFLVAAILAGPSLLAQQKPASVAPSETIAEKRFNLYIDGATVHELAPLLDKALGQPINLIVPPHASDIVLPRLKLHQVTLAELFEALQVASIPKGGNAPAYNFQMTSGNIWIFQVLSWVENPPSPAVAKVSRVFSLDPYLGKLKIEDIITTVQTAWKMSGAGENPEVKFHEETKLLIASGTPDRLEVIDHVLRALSSSVASQKEQALEKELRETQDRVRSDVISSELKVDAMANANARLEQMHSKLQDANAQLEAQVARLRAQIDAAQLVK